MKGENGQSVEHPQSASHEIDRWPWQNQEYYGSLSAVIFAHALLVAISLRLLIPELENHRLTSEIREIKTNPAVTWIDNRTTPTPARSTQSSVASAQRLPFATGVAPENDPPSQIALPLPPATPEPKLEPQPEKTPPPKPEPKPEPQPHPGDEARTCPSTKRKRTHPPGLKSRTCPGTHAQAQTKTRRQNRCGSQTHAKVHPQNPSRSASSNPLPSPPPVIKPAIVSPPTPPPSPPKTRSSTGRRRASRNRRPRSLHPTPSHRRSAWPINLLGNPRRRAKAG